MPGLIRDIQSGKKAADIIRKFRLQIENCVTNRKGAIKSFVSLFAAVYTKSKCAKATNLPGINFDALCNKAVCSICTKPRGVKPCAGSNCNKFFHVDCLHQSGAVRKTRNARKTLNDGAVMCEACSTMIKSTPPQVTRLDLHNS